MYNGWAFVDVDGTLIDCNDNPRPFIKELFMVIKELNLILVVWSGGGREYAEQQTIKLGQSYWNLVDEFRWKDTPVSWNHIRPVWFVDDSLFIKQEHSTDGEKVFLVPFYNSITASHDVWLVRAIEDLKKFYNLYQKGGHKKTLSSSG